MKKIQILVLALLIILTPYKIHAAAAADAPSELDVQSAAPLGLNLLLGCVYFPEELMRQRDLVSLISAIPHFSDEFRSVIDEIKRYHGTVSVVLTDELEKTAYWIGASKTIGISRTLFADQFQFASQLVFEMCNAANKYFAINCQLRDISNSIDTYALFTEACEYQTGYRRQRIAAQFLLNSNGTPLGGKLQEHLQRHTQKSEETFRFSQELSKTRGWRDENDRWSLKLMLLEDSPFEKATKPYKSFYANWLNVNIKDHENGTVSHSDRYRIEFRDHSAYYLCKRREPQGAEWEPICLAIGTLSFEWQIAASMLLHDRTTSPLLVTFAER